MAESAQFVFSLKDIAEMLVQRENIQEGHWGVLVNFGVGGGNMEDQNGLTHPTIIVPIQTIGIQRFAKPNNLTVDAAEVNKKGSSKKKSPK